MRTTTRASEQNPDPGDWADLPPGPVGADSPGYAPASSAPAVPGAHGTEPLWTPQEEPTRRPRVSGRSSGGKGMQSVRLDRGTAVMPAVPGAGAVSEADHGLDAPADEYNIAAPALASDSAPVFVDASGQRRRRARRVAIGAVGVLCGYACLLTISFAGGPIPPGALLPVPGIPGVKNPAPDHAAGSTPAPAPASGAASSAHSDSAHPKSSPSGEGASSRPSSSHPATPSGTAPQPTPSATPPATPPPTGPATPTATHGHRHRPTSSPTT